MQGDILQLKKKEWPIKPENTMDDLECYHWDRKPDTIWKDNKLHDPNSMLFWKGGSTGTMMSSGFAGPVVCVWGGMV